jgi:hypothetical protein
MVGFFKGDRDELGHRLSQIRGLGLTGLGRLYVDEARPFPKARVTRGMAGVDARPRPQPSANSNAEKNKGGRPGLGKPWDGLGISRAEYFRRRKKGGGG